jgi:hypothetical protein
MISPHIRFWKISKANQKSREMNNPSVFRWHFVSSLIMGEALLQGDSKSLFQGESIQMDDFFLIE